MLFVVVGGTVAACNDGTDYGHLSLGDPSADAGATTLSTGSGTCTPGAAAATGEKLDPSTLPPCAPACGGAHCVPTDKVPAVARASFAACGGGLCVPELWHVGLVYRGPDVLVGNEEDLQKGLGIPGPEVAAKSKLDPSVFVKMISAVDAPVCAAISSRASSTRARARRPMPCTEDGFPNASRLSRTAASTCGRSGAVAL